MITPSGQWIPSFAGQQPWQDAEFMEFMRRQGMVGGTGQPQPTGQQRISLPTIHADIYQIDDKMAIDQVSLMPGAPQMFWTKDEHTIVVRTLYANNQHSDRVWVEQPPEPPAPTLNPAEYVRKDELQAMFSEFLQNQAAQRKAPAKDKEVA